MHDLQRRALDAKAARDARSTKKKYIHPSPAYQMYLRVKQRAAEKGWEFNLTAEWFEDHLNQTHCAATGIVFDPEPHGPFSITVDRKENEKGYTPENCWAVCWIYNRAKLNSSHDDVIQMAAALMARHPQAIATGDEGNSV